MKLKKKSSKFTAEVKGNTLSGVCVCVCVCVCVGCVLYVRVLGVCV